MASLEAKNQEIEKVQEMAKIRDEKNREEQQRALEEYQKKAAEVENHEFKVFFL